MELGVSRFAVDAWEPQTIPKTLEAIGDPESEFHRNVGEIIFRQQLLPGKYLEDLQKVFMNNIQDCLFWAKIPDQAVLSSCQGIKTVSLVKWSSQALLNSATKTFFGSEMLRLEPDFCRYICEFDEESWKLQYGFPRILSKKMHHAKEKIINGLTTYFKLSKSKRPGAAWVVTEFEAEMRARGIEVNDIAAIFLGVCWVYVMVIFSFTTFLSMLSLALIITSRACVRVFLGPSS